MDTVGFLRRARDGERLGADDIGAFIGGLVDGSIPDYQAAAYLMAVFSRGMHQDDVVATTLAMRDSGSVVDLSGLKGPKIDKHSTGGVGDKISLPLAPLVASLGVKVPMISGRGLGHTGGTLDKLESIPGFSTGVSIDQFVENVGTLGVSMAGQTSNLVPADKKLYALRDVTATVESIPLITSSILSKKLAEGIGGLVLDVKVGRGAFMKDEASARELAESLVRVGKGAGLRTVALLTRMEQPLGLTIGNALEVRESIAVLKGEGPADVTALTLALGAEMMVLARRSADVEEAEESLEEAIDNGHALDKFRALIKVHGGDPRVVDDPSLLPTAPCRLEIRAPMGGVVERIDSYELGLSAMQLGAGRATAEDTIDPAVGIELQRKVGQQTSEGDVLAILHHRDGAAVDELAAKVKAAFTIGSSAAATADQEIVIDRICG